MANVKIYTNKASITRRLKTAGITTIAKPKINNISVLIELDNRVFAIDRTQKFLEEKAAELSKFGVGKPQFQKIMAIVREVAAERDYLSRLFQNTCGKSWISHRNWNTSAALDKWEGVELKLFCTTIGKVLVLTQRVVSLSLWNHFLHGNYANGIPGNIPDDIDKLACLRTLELGYNFITRGLPSTLGNLRNLKTLHLHFNHIMEGLPSLDHLDSLEVLWLNHNHLEGGIDELKKLKKLKECHIYHNKFSGVVPEELADKKDLTVFKFYGTYLQYGKKVQDRIDSEPGWEGHKASEKPAHIVYD